MQGGVYTMLLQTNKPESCTNKPKEKGMCESPLISCEELLIYSTNVNWRSRKTNQDLQLIPHKHAQGIKI